MYALRPPAVYAHEEVVSDPVCKARLDRVVAALENDPPVTVYNDEDLPAMVKDQGLMVGRKRMGTLDPVPDPILLFNKFCFDDQRDARMAHMRNMGARTGRSLVGGAPFVWFTEEEPAHRVCRPCWRLHFQNGCVHKCHYCQLGGLLISAVNVEDYIEHLRRLIELHPWQETYLLEDDAEVLCLEPELGCLGPIIEFFGTLKDRYLIIHAKSANVDWMLDLKHNGNTIVVWSVATPSQTEAFEPVAASSDERFEAALKCQAAGYLARYKFKPIIPMANWRDEVPVTVERALAQVTPDVISLCVWMWHDFKEMKECLDLSLLDPAFVAAAEAAQEELKDERTRPFPPAVREEIYRFYLQEIRKHNAEVPVSISTEHPLLWKRLAPDLGMNAGNYVCGCGPNSTPWRRKLTCNPFAITAGGPQGGFEAM